MKYHAITSTEIAKIIESLIPKCSYGYTEIPVKEHKISSPFIICPVTHICNKMLSSGIFPDRLKYAEIRQLFKNGDT
jgi:hypothetical protein